MGNKPNYPKPGEKWRHYKGGEYEIICMCNHTETDEILVIYRSESFGGFHARPFGEWEDVVGCTQLDGWPIIRFCKIS